MPTYDELGPVPPSADAYARLQVAAEFIAAAVILLDHPDARMHPQVRAEYASMVEEEGVVAVLKSIAMVLRDDANHHARAL